MEVALRTSFLSTLSLRRATREKPRQTRIDTNFYPRSPCGERLREPTALRTPHQRFLSTLSLRRATSPASATPAASRNFYPRSPCGERPIMHNIVFVPGEFLSTLSLRRATCRTKLVETDTGISIHALLAESDCRAPPYNLMIQQFLSTLSLRRATARRAPRQQPAGISIHALLAESDVFGVLYFLLTVIFLSTLSLRRATMEKRVGISKGIEFLSTLSLRRATRLWTILYSCPGNFYPRSPCGERRRKSPRRCVLSGISIHALLAESDAFIHSKHS